MDAFAQVDNFSATMSANDVGTRAGAPAAGVDVAENPVDVSDTDVFQLRAILYRRCIFTQGAVLILKKYLIMISILFWAPPCAVHG
eukprot:SAG11_NODE_4944_length_1714_cov_4.650155_2_plen_86_part_00